MNKYDDPKPIPTLREQYVPESWTSGNADSAALATMRGQLDIDLVDHLLRGIEAHRVSLEAAAKAADRTSRGIRNATWALVAATGVLVLATVALAYATTKERGRIIEHEVAPASAPAK